MSYNFGEEVCLNTIKPGIGKVWWDKDMDITTGIELLR